MRGKLRPVGSLVPLPTSRAEPLPWDGVYQVEYCASGTDALALAVGLAALEKPGVRRPEVIIPAYGCPDLVAAIVSQGARPVLVDLKADTPFMDSHSLSGAITDRTVAVVGVGLLGIPERLDILAAICRKHDIRLIEDSAQCFPPRSAETPLADFVVLSFGRGKPINLMGGGALLYGNRPGSKYEPFLNDVVTSDLSTGVLWHLKRLAFNLLLTRYGYFLLDKLPFLGLGQTRYHSHPVIRRLKLPPGLLYGGVRDYYARPLPHRHYEQELQDLEAESWVLLGSQRFEAYGLREDRPRLRFGILAPDRAQRDEAVRALNCAGIGANGLYEEMLADIAGVAEMGVTGEFPQARAFASRLLTLPSHEDVTKNDVRKVAFVLKSLNAANARR